MKFMAGRPGLVKMTIFGAFFLALSLCLGTSACSPVMKADAGPVWQRGGDVGTADDFDYVNGWGPSTQEIGSGKDLKQGPAPAPPTEDTGDYIRAWTNNPSRVPAPAAAVPRSAPAAPPKINPTGDWIKGNTGP